MAKNPKILESVYSIRDIQIFGAGSRRMKEVDEANRNVNHASFWLTVHRQTIASFPNFFVYLARILILVCAGVLASRGINHPVGTIAISFAATASLSSTFNLTFVVTSLLETYGAAERIFKIEDTMSETEEPANPVSCGEIQTIEFSDVTFSYPGTEKKVLDHFNLRFGREEKIGIAGASGAGKSTILRLLLRFYAPEEGEIRINGIPLEQISFAELHQRIAFLEQDTYLFDATIAENIAIAKPDASIEEIRTAAERAGIAEFIETLPEGYQTDMGQMSARLSGGERQRIGIARIFLRDPDLCLMDEPSSTLDAQHEKELLHTLKTEYGKKISCFMCQVSFHIFKKSRSSDGRRPLRQASRISVVRSASVMAQAFIDGKAAAWRRAEEQCQALFPPSSLPCGHPRRSDRVAEQTGLFESGEHIFSVAVGKNQRLFGKFGKRKRVALRKKRVVRECHGGDAFF